jgi:DNA-directed RNA polymerase subunit H (RpoH/RPB5)
MIRAYEVFLGMMKKRGFIPKKVPVPSEDIVEMTGYYRFDGPNGRKKIYVLWTESFDTGSVEKIISQAKPLDEKKKGAYNHFISIYSEKFTPPAKGKIENLELIDPTIVIEVFSVTELQTDITDHVLVPAHTQVSEEKKQEVMKVYGCNEKNIPKIVWSDAIRRFYNFPLGSLIEIKRPTRTFGTYNISYRIVTR